MAEKKPEKDDAMILDVTLAEGDEISCETLEELTDGRGENNE